VCTRLTAISACFLLALTGIQARQSRLTTTAASPFENYLESLRAQAGIPGMSAALVQEGQIVWERGFGFQNQEGRIRANPDTPYPIADLTQTLASVLVLQCVEQRQVGLDDPIRRYGVVLPEPGTTLRNLLSHAAVGSATEAYRYDPERYAQLTAVVEACVPQPYRKTVAVLLLDRLAMKDSVPGRDVVDPNAQLEKVFGPDTLDRYRRVLERLAVPYKVDKRGRLTRTELSPESLTAATGLVSTVRDLARFDEALDSALLLREDTITEAWTNARNGNTSLPTGLGWFVQLQRGEPVVWHFGNVPNAYSSLVIKLPSRRLTFILLANSDGLSAPFQLDAGDVTKSLFATLFLRLFT
jgi:CubicO group peptidase (beta-lactamase class C family)